jgi:cytochrome P450
MGLVDSLISDASWTQLSVVGLVLLVLFNLIKTTIHDAKIRKLGLRAPIKPAWLPFGIDLAYGGVKSLLANETLEYFQTGMLVFDYSSPNSVADLFSGLSKYGNKNHPYTIEMSVAGNRVIFTADDLNIKAILATQFNDYGKGEQFNKDWHEFLGDSIFTTDGDKWHNSRQLIRPQFIKDRLSDIDIFEKHCEILLPLLGGQPGGGKTVDALDLFFRFTLDASTDFLLGHSVESLKHGQVAFADAFNDVQHVQSLIARTQDLNFVVPRGKFRRQLKVMNQFVDTYVDRALSLSPAELEAKTKGDEGYTFLHAIAGYTRDRKVLRDQIVAVLLAGRDTTACTLSWLFYELSSKPEIVARLRAEILEIVGPNEKPTYETLKSMKFLTVR